jgi:hypothetical protein
MAVQYLLRKKWLLTVIILGICAVIALLIALLLIHPQMGTYTDASYI